MNLFIYTGASRLNAAVVESATDLTPVSRLPDLIVGDSEPVTVKFLSASGAYESWSGGGTYTLSISIGALGADGVGAYFQTSGFTTVTNGWTGRLDLAASALRSAVGGYLADRPGVTGAPLTLQVRVTDASGNTETYARQSVVISGAVSVPTTADSTPVTYATAADVAADAATASAAAIAAAASASAASGSASTAAGHVTTAGNSATAAAASATTAGNSATTASGHATTATTQATNAATSASSASTYKDAAAVSASSATSSAGTATTQAALATTNGAAQVTLAAAQVTLATTQATNAGTSASAAAVSAAAALVSEAAALVSKNAAAASAATASAVSGSGNGTFSAAALTGVNSITASTSTPLTLTGGSTGASLALGQGTTAGTITLTPTGSGTVAIAGAKKLRPSGDIYFSATNPFVYTDVATNVTGLEISGNSAYLNLWTNNLERARFTSTGNLLIGTTTDAASLSGGLVINGSGTASAASNTTTGALRVTGGVGVSGAGYFGSRLAMTGTASYSNIDSSLAHSSSYGFVMQARAGSVYDFALFSPGGTADIMRVPTGTNNVQFPGAVTAIGQTSLDTAGAVARALIVGPVAQSGGNLPYASIKTGIADFGLAVENTNAVSGQGLGLRIVAGATASDLPLYVRDRTNATTLFSVGGTGAAAFAGAVTIAGTVIHTLSATPASASATGTVGTMSWDANYIYICTATNTWKRVAIATW